MPSALVAAEMLHHLWAAPTEHAFHAAAAKIAAHVERHYIVQAEPRGGYTVTAKASGEAAYFKGVSEPVKLAEAVLMKEAQS